MAIKLKGGGTAVVRGVSLADTGAAARHDYVTVQTAGGSVIETTIGDAIFDVYTGATYHREGNVLVEGMLEPNFTNLNPDVGSISQGGNVTRLSSGVMNVIVRDRIVALPLELDLTDKTEPVGQPLVYLSTVPGSLAAHIQNEVDSRIDNTMTKAVHGKVFSTQDHTTPAYVRNSSLWCADVDLTCISPWNSNLGNKKAGTLVTPRHIIGAAHYEYNVGTIVRFVAADNTVYNRTVTGKKRHPSYKPYSPDLTIYTLDSDLPVAISPCSVLPSNHADYLVNNYATRPPGLVLDQEEKALIADFYNGFGFVFPVDADRLIFSESLIVGDSGNPGFLIVNGELVLVTVWTFGGAGAGTPVAQHIAALNQMIVDADTAAGVSTGYTVTEADFSAFPNYS